MERAVAFFIGMAVLALCFLAQTILTNKEE